MQKQQPIKTLAKRGPKYGFHGTSHKYVANKTAKIDLTDGATTKSVWGSALIADSSVPNAFFNVDLVVFLKAGDSCSITTPSNAVFFGSSRQIADIDGNLVNPT